MNRKEAREFTMQTLFQMEVQKAFENLDIDRFLNREQLAGQNVYVETLLKGIAENLQQVDGILNENSQGWPTSRMAKVDLAILRLAIGEMLYMEEVPTAVSINEAVNMAKKYGAAQSAKFINAVLGKAVTSLDGSISSC
ncbi:MAG: transcription antitermination factor NusB [Firmicutes bacterium]|nr:transcription antitermination factor NusB [Bacillota bacterium]